MLTVEDWLSGSWKLEKQGADYNHDKIFDESEKNTVPDTLAYSIQFQHGGKGFEVGHNSSYVDTLTWELLDGEKILHVKVNDSGFLEEYYYHFDFTSSQLTLFDTSVTPGFFKFFNRES